MAESGSGVATVQQRRFHCWFRSIETIFLVLLVSFLSMPCSNPLGQQLRPEVVPQNSTGICSSVDIRSTLSAFDKLRGCRVVEGFVQVLLFDNFNDSSFANVTFPELTEITDYLLLYRVNGLRTLGHMFPNLAVIRGQHLFFDYALVIFEMSSLQDVGLYSLTDITRGLVRIDKNPSLCFMNSVDWELITHEKGENFIKNIRPENECPLCPGDGATAHTEESVDEPRLSCPNSTRDNFNTNRHLCWNTQHCQKICSAKCGPNRSCNEMGECCDEKCLGGCSVKRSNCTVCRNFYMGSPNDRQCMNRCPEGYYEHLKRRCITKPECEKMRKPVQFQENALPEYPYKIFKNSCVLDCPKNYMDDYSKHVCIPCKGRCKKECPPINVDTVDIAKQLRGCTHITGPLEIQIRGGTNVVNELEESMNMIEEIDGYLKIVRSFPLISLNFLKSLRVISGKTLESDKYAFVVLDNQNLQDIWDWENRTLTIGNNGKLFFHFNPKLCYQEIEKLQQKAHLPELNDIEVAPSSNGDKIACTVTKMDVEIYQIASRGVILKWEPFPMDDPRKLLGYVVYSIEAPYRNVSLYDGRDACGGDGWKVNDVGVQQELHLLIHLKPYTQYAFYIKTYTTATYRNGAQSDIQYFRTLPDEPSEPRNVVIISNASDSFIITWDPPLEPNGNVTHYIVTGKKHEESESDAGDRNYCTNPLLTVEPTPTVETQKPKPDNKSCVCDGSNKGSSSETYKEEEVLSQIQFEDALHNVVYVKRLGEIRKKRDISGDESFPQIRTDKSNINNISNLTENGSNIWESFSFTVYRKTELHVTNLHHFTFYHVNIQACRERESKDDKNNNCSRTALKTARTRWKEGANNVTNVRVLNVTAEMVTVSWDEPADPNGIILTYSIEYKSSVLDTKPYGSCITRRNFVNSSSTYVIRKLSPGKYTLRVAAVSHAGMGHYSQDIYFTIIESSSSPTVPLTIFAIFFVICVTFAVLWYLRRKKLATSRTNKLIRDINPEYVSTEYVVDDWEVQRKNVELKRELGQGSFGMVYEGLGKDLNGKPQIKCAVKTVNEHATNRERVEFLNEASVMKAFDTAHVVRLLGVVSQGQPTLVIMELMANGDLKSYLRSHRPDAENYNPAVQRQPPSLKRILQMAVEIADGMAYLAAKKFVHRDLAARNCMVAEDLTVKIGDFGMTRDIYETDYYRKGTKGLLPVRWMAPESLKDGVFTSSSDIWSYGVVLWEMATLASQPYQGLSNEQVLRYVIDGGVMERPENCPDKLYALMQFCWKHKPASRPTFLELCALLIDDACPTFSQISFYHSSLGIEARNARRTPSLTQDDPTTPLRGTRDPENFSLPNSEDESEELQIDDNCARIDFSSFPKAPKESSTLANGHVNNRPTNGIATAQW